MFRGINLIKPQKFLKSVKNVNKKILPQKRRLHAEPPKGWSDDGTRFEKLVGVDISEIMVKANAQKKVEKKLHPHSTVINEDFVEKNDEALREKLQDEIKNNPDTYNYKTKYPDVQIKDVLNKYKNAYLDYVDVADSVIDDATELSGYDRDEVVGYLRPQMPDWCEFNSNGELKYVNWESVKKDMKIDERVGSMMDSVNASYEFLKKRVELNEETDTQQCYFDWQVVERNEGEEKALKERERYRDLYRSLYKPTDNDMVVKTFEKFMWPRNDFIKDKLIDDFPFFDELCKFSRSSARQLEVDEDGLPVWEFFSFEYIDNFYPDIRDQVLVELDNFNFDTEYKAEFKELSHKTPEELYELMSEETMKTKYEEFTDKFFSSNEDTTLSKREAQIQKKVNELEETIEKKNQLTNVVEKLKAQLEYVEEMQASEGKVAAKKDTIELEDSDILFTSMGIDPNSSNQVVKDWKHKPHEVVNTDAKEEQTEEKKK